MAIYIEVPDYFGLPPNNFIIDQIGDDKVIYGGDLPDGVLLQPLPLMPRDRSYLFYHVGDQYVICCEDVDGHVFYSMYNGNIGEDGLADYTSIGLSNEYQRILNQYLVQNFQPI
jgi:hypothetical protein